MAWCVVALFVFQSFFPVRPIVINSLYPIPDQLPRFTVVLGADDAGLDTSLGHARWGRRRAAHHSIPLAAQQVRRYATLCSSLCSGHSDIFQVRPSAARIFAIYPVKDVDIPPLDSDTPLLYDSRHFM